MGDLFRLLDKSDLVAIILITSFAVGSIVVILVATTNTISAFGVGFELLGFLVDQAFNCGHVCLSKACLFVIVLSL